MASANTQQHQQQLATANPGAHMAAAVDAEIARFRELQGEIGKLRGDQQTLLAQRNENEMVQQELNLLPPDARVFKMVGPVLFRKELEDAKQTVDKRLEFIRGETTKVEKSLEKKETLANEKAKKVQELQGLMQKAAVEAARAMAAETKTST
mmetsp:Transcript_32930/g.75833  ORF Transcript_32930/g.75833 Transcript_32930/m.75833 type:complete len:152 (+) Transcript_32930:74-529(+)